MAVDFSAFDEQVDLEELQKEVQDAPETNFTDVPDGEYEISFDNMEIKETKAKDKLMFSVQCNILDGDQKGRKIFFNRTIFAADIGRNYNDKSICNTRFQEIICIPIYRSLRR